MQNDSKAGPPERKPWPMWPIVVSIVSFMAFYTWVQLTFRKEEKPYEPSHRMQQRQSDIAEKNMYDWYSLFVESKEATENGEPLTRAPVSLRFIEGPLENDLPAQIVYYIPRRPLLVPKIESLAVPSSVEPGKPIVIQFEMPSAFGDSPNFNLTSFYKEGLLLLMAEMHVDNQTALDAIDANSELATYRFAIDSKPMEAETIEAQLYAEGQVREWSMINSSAN